MAAIPVAGWLVSSRLAIGLALLCVLGSVFIEVARRSWPWFNRLLRRFLPTVFRPGEEHDVLGSTWFALGALAALLLLGRDAGGMGILFLALGDPAAEIAGRRWGRHGQRKTLAGSLGCLAACLLALALGWLVGDVALWSSLAGAMAATLVERWSPPPDDNVWIPVISGGAFWLVRLFVGS